MNLKTLGDRILVSPEELESTTAGGIIIPDTAKEKPMMGVVISAGPGLKNKQDKLIPLSVREGDRVLYGKWSGTEIEIKNKKYLIMKESDIFGVIES